MKKQKSVWTFVGGALLGVCLTLCIAAAEKETAPKNNWSHLQIVTYTSGATGFFDSNTGRLYLYDTDLQKCFLIRQLTEPGAPLSRP